MRISMRKIGAVVAATAATLALGATPAHADYDDCGSTVFNYGKTGLNGCFLIHSDGSFQTEALFRIVSPTTPGSWTKCNVRIALFKDNVQRRIIGTKDEISCMADAQTNTGSYYKDSYRFFLQAGHCYRAVVRWVGTYAGNSVGSNPNAESPEWCAYGPPSAAADLTDLLMPAEGGPYEVMPYVA